MTEQKAGAAGYSGTPLAKKLGVKPGHIVALRHRPEAWDLPGLPDGVTIQDGGIETADVAVAFFRARADLEADVPMLSEGLQPAASLWIAWPRRAAGHTSDITENLLRELVLPTGMVDIKVAALGEDWSGLKFMWRKENRPGSR